MRHWAGSRLAVVDCETTCGDPELSEIWQFTCICADDGLQPLKPFLELTIRPENKDACDRQLMRLSEDEFDAVMNAPLNHAQAAEKFEARFREWQSENFFGIESRLLPLAQNWPFDREQIIKWIGQKQFDIFFHPWYRDPMSFAMILNDMFVAGCWVEQQRYERANNDYLANYHKVVNERAHDATQDCLTTLEIYRRMILSHAEGLTFGDDTDFMLQVYQMMERAKCKP
jgi:hypothetical protein